MLKLLQFLKGDIFDIILLCGKIKDIKIFVHRSPIEIYALFLVWLINQGFKFQGQIVTREMQLVIFTLLNATQKIL